MIKKIAIVGFGEHVQRNILPAIDRNSALSVEQIFVRRKITEDGYYGHYSDKVQTLSEPILDDVEWVYIGTPISTHYELANKYLEMDKNVICEKPLTPNFEEANYLINKARAKNLRIHEVCMFQHHKQYNTLQNRLSKIGTDLRSVSAKFAIPHLDHENIRYKKSACGGSLMDIGYYPIRIIASLFGKPITINSVSLSEPGYEVDLTGCMLMDYKSFYATAEWGMGVPYKNEIVITTSKNIYKYDRIFSKPNSLSVVEESVIDGKSHSLEIGCDDQFLNMFEYFILGQMSDAEYLNEQQVCLSVIAQMEKVLVS